jgi:hypothetical protein
VPASTGSDAEFEWITDEKWLVAQGVAQWTEIPLWRTYRGVWAVDSVRAHTAGFVTRPLRDTVAGTWEWLNSGDTEVAHERAVEQGISAEKEAAILGVWDARNANRCGGS